MEEKTSRRTPGSIWRWATIVLVVLLAATIVLSAVLITNLTGQLSKICDFSKAGVRGSLLSLGDRARDGARDAYMNQWPSAVQALGVLKDCPLSPEEHGLYSDIGRLVLFGTYPNIWSNRTHLDVFGTGLMDISGALSDATYPRDAILRTQQLFTDLEGLGYIVP